jgi:hypothetical protein
MGATLAGLVQHAAAMCIGNRRAHHHQGDDKGQQR